MRLSDYIITFLAQHGVRAVFTIPGGGSVFLNDALTVTKAMPYFCCHHEQAAAMAAEAYARVSKSIGFTLVTSGPGATNAITGAAGSWTDSVPHLIISGQVFFNQTIRHTGVRQMGVQEINIIDMIKPITKYAVMITSAQDIKYHLQKALYLAQSGRPGPVWLDIPADIQMSQIDETKLREFSASEISEIKDPEEKQKQAEKTKSSIARVVELLQDAKRPLVHVGQGVKIANAEKEFFTLIEHYQLPFVTARNANDIVDSSHPLFVGRPGTFAQRGANFAAQNADVYLAIGTRLSFPQTGYNSKDYVRRAIKIMVDIDRAELYKDSLAIDIKIESDAKKFLQELLQALENSTLKENGPTWRGDAAGRWEKWITRCKEWQKKYPVVLPSYEHLKKGINSFYFIALLSKALDSSDVIVTDMGFAFQTTHMAFQIKKGQQLLTNCGMAAMGWGLPAAVGACIAHEKKRTICIAGDGGLQMNLQELATVMHHQLPIKIFIYNNGGYLTMKQTFEDKFEGRVMGSDSSTGLSFPDYIKIAEAHHFPNMRINNHQELKKNLSLILQSTGPFICELMMEEDQAQIPKFLPRRGTDGKNLPTPIEDLYPYLPLEELEENLRINEE